VTQAARFRHHFSVGVCSGENIELHSDVLPALNSLGTRYILGLVSNGNTHPERCGLQDRLKFVVFAQDVGVEKPDPALFRVACEAGRLCPR
jgi:putative hydrolase of the HAD superfamily